MEYDPVSNWRVPFTSTSLEPETPSSTPTYSPSPILPGNSTPATTIRNNLANNDTSVPLSRKNAPAPVQKATSYPLVQKKTSMTNSFPANQGMQAGLNQFKRKTTSQAGMPDQASAGSPVMKRARFAGRAAAESPVEGEKRSGKEVKQVKPKKKADIDEAEVMRHLFGEDDEDEDGPSIIELPIEMYNFSCFIIGDYSLIVQRIDILQANEAERLSARRSEVAGSIAGKDVSSDCCAFVTAFCNFDQ